MLRRLILSVLSLLLLCTTPQFAFAHGDSHDDGGGLSELEEIEKLIQLYQYAVDFTPEVLTDDHAPRSIPYLTISGKKVYMNSHFWNLVGDWISVYHGELVKDCPQCLLPTPDEIFAEAQSQPAKGFARRVLVDPLAHSGKEITLEAIDLGAQLGKVAFVLKVTSEVAETVLSKMMGGAGVHIFCTAIDAAILFGTRYIQTSLRVPGIGSDIGAGRLRSMARVAYISRVLRRARRRVRIEAGPITLDEHVIDEIDHEGPNRWWGLVHGGKREAFLESLKKRQLKMEKKLADLDAKIAEKSNSFSRRRLERKREKILKDYYPVAKLHRSAFIGKRYKRFLWLKARRRGYSEYMQGSTWMDKKTKDPTLWILSVQENVLNRAILGDASAPNLANLEKYRASLPNYPDDEIRHYLAESFTSKLASSPQTDQAQQVTAVEHLLQDIEYIFDPKQPKKNRYLTVLMLESGINSFVYKWMLSLTEAKFRAFNANSEIARKEAKARWALGNLAHVMSEFSDFLRVAATTPKADVLMRYKYESMEFYLQTLSALFSAGKILEARTPADFTSHIESVTKHVRDLRADMPWKEKRMRLPKPLAWRAPMCSKLHRRAQ